MRRVIRRTLTRDPAGRAVSIQSERLTDDGQGAIHFTSERSTQSCSGCRRIVADLSEHRGLCDWCRSRNCCVHCEAQCHVCSRRLCGDCRRGFAGPPQLTVCQLCQQRLSHRQALDDQLKMEQVAFEREIERHRMINQVQALQLTAERVRFAEQMQLARLPPPQQKLWIRVLKWCFRVLFAGIRYVWNALR